VIEGFCWICGAKWEGPHVAECITVNISRAEAAEARVAELEGAISHPGIRRDLLWMAEGRKKENRKHVDELLALAAPDPKEGTA